jgi:hypothetical protein
MQRTRLSAVWLSLSLCVACGSSTPTQYGSTSGAGAGNGGGAGTGTSVGGTATAGAESGAGSMTGTSGSAGTAPSGGGGAAGSAAGTGGGGSSGGSGQPNTEQPPDGVPPTYQLVYSQTFAEPTSLNDLVFANPTEWKHDPGGFIASTGFSYAPPYRSPFSVAVIKAIKVKSFVMDAEMLQTSPDGDAHRDMVLIWNFVSPSQFYYSHISTAHDGVAHNILVVDNAERTAISATYTQGYDWGRGVWKKLRVVRDVESGAMAVYDLDVPQDPILTASDKRFIEGYVGFGSFDNTGQVRNVKVWAATSTPGAPDFFSAAQ